MLRFPESLRLSKTTGFQWDEGNAEKNWIRHKVSQEECEQLFFNEPLLVATDTKHSVTEPRFFALGQSKEGRRLFVVFTIREQLIRIISGRDMSSRERNEYDH